MRQEGQGEQESDACVSHPPAVGLIQLPQRFESGNMLQALIMDICDTLQVLTHHPDQCAIPCLSCRLERQEQIKERVQVSFRDMSQESLQMTNLDPEECQLLQRAQCCHARVSDLTTALQVQTFQGS